MVTARETPILQTSHLPLSPGLGNVQLEVAMFPGLDRALSPKTKSSMCLFLSLKLALS